MACRNACFYILHNLLIPERIVNNSLICFLDFPWFSGIDESCESWAYYGEALAIIRPEGDVTLKAKSPFGKEELTIRQCRDA